MHEKTYTVYIHTTPDGRVYIGSTSQPVRKRWNGGHGYRNNRPFWEAIQRYGWENIKHEIIAELVHPLAAAAVEAMLIRLYRSDNPLRGFNRSKSGRGFKGGKHTEETRQRMSESHRRTKERGAVYVLRLDGDNLHAYSTITKAAELTGIDPANISKAVHGQRKTAGGYEWILGQRHQREGAADIKT